MRVFTEASLRAILCNAGFPDVHFAADSIPEFGVEHAESWSLPDRCAEKRNSGRRWRNWRCNIAKLSVWRLERFAIWKRSRRSMSGTWRITIWRPRRWVRDASLRAEWVKKVEAAWEERTEWAFGIQKARDEAIAEFAALPNRRPKRGRRWTLCRRS